MIHREGYKSILIATLVAVICQTGGLLLFRSHSYITIGITIVDLLLISFIIQFFRNPKREIFPVLDGVLSPADGKVLVIETTKESEFLETECVQISIFMSPFNIHKNLNPIQGVIEKIKYHPGKFLVAYHPKSSTENERCSFLYKTKTNDFIVMRQIAGAVARRIVWYLKPNQTVEMGNEMGFIKFGSRVDLFIPGTYVIKVKLGETVRAGQTLIAEKPTATS